MNIEEESTEEAEEANIEAEEEVELSTDQKLLVLLKEKQWLKELLKILLLLENRNLTIKERKNDMKEIDTTNTFMTEEVVEVITEVLTKMVMAEVALELRKMKSRQLKTLRQSKEPRLKRK